jgi:hypothetical protein
MERYGHDISEQLMFLRVDLFAIYAHVNTPRRNSLVYVELVTAKDQTLRVFVEITEIYRRFDDIAIKRLPL